MRRTGLPALLLATLPLLSLPPAARAEDALLARGRLLTRIGGCNDCHTPGYAQSAGKTPESEWLKGSPVGFRGPWGTSYPVNLRRFVGNMSEAQWLHAIATDEPRPPMPWYDLRAMSRTDQVALYRFIKSLRGDPGPAAPEILPPGQEPTGPYIPFAPPVMPAH